MGNYEESCVGAEKEVPAGRVFVSSSSFSSGTKMAQISSESVDPI